jgi:hypothetical protein
VEIAQIEAKIKEGIEAVKRRKRFLNGISGLRLFGSWFVGLTFTLALGYLALGGDLRLYVLGFAVGLSVLACLFGFLLGYFRKVDLGAALYQMDKALGLEEKLCTIYSLQKSPTKPQLQQSFLWMLYRRVEQIKINSAVLKKVFPVSAFEKAWLVGLAALMVGMGILFMHPWGMWGEMEHHMISEEAEFKEEKEIAKLNLKKKKEITEKISALEEKIAKLKRRIERGEIEEPAKSEEIAKLYAELESARGAIWGIDTAGSLPKGNQTSELKETLESIQEDLKGGLTAEQRAFLEQLSEQIEDEKLKELIQKILKTQDQKKLEELVERALEEIAAGQEAEEALSELEQALDVIASSGSEEEAKETEESWEGLSGQEGVNERISEREQREGIGDEESILRGLGRGREGAWRLQRTDRLPFHEQLEGGELAGEIPDVGKDKMGYLPTSQVPQFYQVQIPGLYTGEGFEREMLAKGLPLEVIETENGSVYRIDYEKMEIILELRNIPPKLREVIKRYFSQVAEAS